MKKILPILILVWATVAWADAPALKLSMDSAGYATIKPILPAGTPIKFFPYALDSKNCLLGIAWIQNGKPDFALYALPLQYDGSPFPSPNPTPDPKPEPKPEPKPDPPPPPIGKLWPIIIYESKDITPAQSKVITSKAVADFVQTKNHHKFWIVDKDAVDEKNQPPASIKEYTKRATTLPFMFLVSEGGVIVFEGPLPDEAGVLELLKKFGGG